MATYNDEDLENAFDDAPRGTRLVHRLAQVADMGGNVIREDVLEKIDDLIWRRKMQEKPHDQLDEIKALVEQL